MASKNTFYFSHDGGARNDDKMIAVRMKHKAEGYAVYFMILEKMLESSDYTLFKDYNVLAFDFRVGSDLVKSIVEDFGLFEFTEDNKSFFSKSFQSRMKPFEDVKQLNRVKGIKGNLIKHGYLSKEEINKMSDNEVIKFNEDIKISPNGRTTVAERPPSLPKNSQRIEENSKENTTTEVVVEKKQQKKDLGGDFENSNFEEIPNSTSTKNFEEEKELPEGFATELRNSQFFVNVCEFFSQKSELLQMKVVGRMISIARENDFQEFIKQTTAYMNYKNQTGERSHRFQNFSFEWDQEDWIDKFKKLNQAQNGIKESKSDDIIVGRVNVTKTESYLESRRKQREMESSENSERDL